MIPRPILALAAAAAFFAPTHSAHAQSLTLAADGSTLTPLLVEPAGHEIQGFDVDAAGDIFYLDQDQSTGATQFMEKPIGSSAISLFDAGTFSFGSFVRIQGDQIYFSYAPGSNSTLVVGTIGQPASTWLQFDTQKSAYDLTFDAGGNALLSANPNGFSAGNHIYQVGIDSGSLTLTPRLSIPFDVSGPIAFDQSGRLLYGASSLAAPAGGIYRVSLGSPSNPELTLDSSSLATMNASNEFFAYGEGLLFQDAVGSASILEYGGEGLGASDFGEISHGLSLGNLEFESGMLYASATDFSAGTSYLFAVAVPEPGSAGLLLIGGLLLAGKRRHSRK